MQYLTRGLFFMPGTFLKALKLWLQQLTEKILALSSLSSLVTQLKDSTLLLPLFMISIQLSSSSSSYQSLSAVILVIYLFT